MDNPPFPGTLGTAAPGDETTATIEGVVYEVADRRAVTGPMARFLGERLTYEQLLDNEYAIGPSERGLAFARAYPVPTLVGAVLVAGDPSDMRATLEALLGERLPGVPWRLDFNVRLNRYGLLHTSVSGPADETTGQPMALELCGQVVQADPTPQSATSRLWHVFGRSSRWAETVADTDGIRIRIAVATYANLMFTGIGVPLYL